MWTDISLARHPAKRLTTESLHHSERSGDRAVRHDPHLHVTSLRMQGQEIPCIIMGSLGLGDLVVRLGLQGVDKIREFDGMLNEENRHVVADCLVSSCLEG